MGDGFWEYPQPKTPPPPPPTTAPGKAPVSDANNNFGIWKVTKLEIGPSGSEVAVTSTPAELNVLHGVTPGTTSPSSALVVSASGALNALAIGTATISGGTIDNTIIGGNTPDAGYFTAVTVTYTTQGSVGLNVNSAVAGGNILIAPNLASGDFNGLVQAGDSALVFSSSSGEGTGALCLVAWVASGVAGIRITPTEVTINGLAATQQAGVPTTAELAAGLFGIYKDTSGGGVYLAYNDGGTIKTISPSTSQAFNVTGSGQTKDLVLNAVNILYGTSEAALTLLLPLGTLSSDFITVVGNVSITTLTITTTGGQSVENAPAAFAAGHQLNLYFNGSNWFCGYA